MTAQNNNNNFTLPEDIPNRAIPTAKTWSLLLDAYKRVKKGSDLTHDQPLYDRTDDNPMAIEYEVRQTEEKGRGLFCTQDIARDATVCLSRTGRFRTEAEWREFLSLVPHELAMDCVDWAGVDEDDDDDDDSDSDENDDQAVTTEHYVFLDLCDTSLMNHGSFKDGKANCTEQQMDDGAWHAVATRDIVAGEELLCDYALAGSGYDHNLDWFKKIHQEYYPGVPIDSTEIDRFS